MEDVADDDEQERADADGSRAECSSTPPGMEAMPLEYWHYDEDLWRPSLLEDRAGILPEALPALRRTKSHRRRGSLPGDEEPSEPAPVVKAPALQAEPEAESGEPPPFWEMENCGPPAAAAAAVCADELGPR